MARKTIGAIQSDPKINADIYEKYAKDAGQLIALAEVAALCGGCQQLLEIKSR